MSAQVQLVVAKYKEEVRWLADMPYPALVYDKWVFDVNCGIAITHL